MYCSKCGNEVPDGLRFGPSCGQRMDAVRAEPAQQPAQQQAQYPVRQPAQYPSRQPGQQAQQPLNPGNYYVDVKTKKKGVSMKVLLPILISVVLVAAIVTGIVLFPRFRRSEGDVFAEAKSSAKSKSDESYMLDVLSAAHNTVFNSKSMTVRLSADGETYFSGKLVFGKDLPSSECYASVEGGDFLVCLQDGVLVFGEEDDTFIEINVADLVQEKASLLSTVLNDRLQYSGADSTQAGTVINLLQGLVDTCLSLVKDNHIDYSSVKSLGATYISYITTGLRGGMDMSYASDLELLADEEMIQEIFSSVSEEDFENLYSALAEFIASGADGAFEVEKSKSSGQTQYDVSVDLGEMLNALADYIAENDTFRSLLGDTAAANLKDAIKNNGVNNFKGESLKFKVTVDGKKLQSIELTNDYNEKFRIILSDIDSTKIDDMDSVRRKADDFYTVQSVQDVVKLINEF